MWKQNIFCFTSGQPVLSCSLCLVNFFLFSLCSVMSTLCSPFHCLFRCLRTFLFSVFPVWKRTRMPCTCMVHSGTLLPKQYRTDSACNTLLWWQEILCVIELERIHIFKFYYEEVRFTGSGFSTSPLTSVSVPLSQIHTLSHKLRWRQVSREVGRYISKPFTQSFSIPRSQTSLCCSKNKIPPVKLSAPRFSAFNAEANQKLERDAKHAHSGKVVDHAWNVVLLQGCAKVQAQKSTEIASSKNTFKAVPFIFGTKKAFKWKTVLLTRETVCQNH